MKEEQDDERGAFWRKEAQRRYYELEAARRDEVGEADLAGLTARVALADACLAFCLGRPAPFRALGDDVLAAALNPPVEELEADGRAALAAEAERRGLGG